MHCSSQIAKFSDRDNINLIIRKSLGYWEHDEDYIATFMSKLGITEEYMRHQVIHLLYSDNQLFGFYCFKEQDATIHLDFLFLLPEYIGKGLGRWAWKELCKDARQQGASEFLIYSQPGSEGFYVKMGCEKIGERESFIRPGMIIPLMRYHLAHE